MRVFAGGLVVAMTIPRLLAGEHVLCPYSLDPEDEGHIFAEMCDTPSTGCLFDLPVDGRAYAELERMGADAVPALIDGLQIGNGAIASACDNLLLGLGAGVAAQCLLAALEESSGCGHMPTDLDPVAVHARDLVGMLPQRGTMAAGETPTPEEVHRRIGDVLYRMTDREEDGEIALRALVSRLGGDSPALQDCAVSALGSRGQASLPYTGQLASLVARSPDWEIRFRVLTVLESINHPDAFDEPSIAAVLIGALDEVVEVRRAASALLATAQLPQGRALVPLLIAAGDPDPMVRFHAIQAMGLLRLPTAAVFPVLASAASDRDPAIRFVAVRAVGQLATAEADREDVAAVLARVLEDGSPEVRAMAAHVRAKLPRR